MMAWVEVGLDFGIYVSRFLEDIDSFKPPEDCVCGVRPRDLIPSGRLDYIHGLFSQEDME